MKYYGQHVPFGVGPIPKLVGFPKGKIRIRMRNDDFVRIFIRTKRRFICTIPVASPAGRWHYFPAFNYGINAR